MAEPLAVVATGGGGGGEELVTSGPPGLMLQGAVTVTV
jgi:hypothetical protein